MNANIKASTIESAVAAALASLSARASFEAKNEETTFVSFKNTKAEKAPKTEKVSRVKAAKAAKAAKAEKAEHKIPQSFPVASPLNVADFLAKVNGKIETAPGVYRKPDTMELFSYCHGFVAWLKETNNAAIKTLSPAMAPGALLDNCRRIIRSMNDSTFLVADDHSNRNGMVVVFGSAGTNHRFNKILGSMQAMLIQAEADMLKNREEALIKAELSKELLETDPTDAAQLEQEAIVHAGMAAIEEQRAEEIRKVIEEKDLTRMEALYEQLGAKEVVQETLVGYDFGSFGKLEAEVIVE